MTTKLLRQQVPYLAKSNARNQERITELESIDPYDLTPDQLYELLELYGFKPEEVTL